MTTVIDLPLHLIDETDYHARFEVDPNTLADLAGSIAKLGLLVPLIVRPVGERYALIAGRRRKAALLLLGRDTAPCVILDQPEEIARQSAIADNLIRLDPTPIETAVAIARAVQGGEAAITEIAAAMHRSPDWVRRQLALLDWPEDVQQAIHSGKISVAAASNLALIEEDDYRRFLLQNACDNGATARTTAAWLQAWRAALPAPQALAQPPIEDGPRALPLVPQAPCLCCGQVYRTDELSHVPLCGPCIQRVRHLGDS